MWLLLVLICLKSQQSQPDGVKRMTMVSAEGGRYTGETNMEGKRQGRGEYIWPNNDRYMGDFADGVKNGNGILYFANGDKRVKRVFITSHSESVDILIYVSAFRLESGKMTSFMGQRPTTTLWEGIVFYFKFAF